MILYYPVICTEIFEIVSFFQVSVLNPCLHFISLPYVLHVTAHPVSSSYSDIIYNLFSSSNHGTFQKQIVCYAIELSCV